MPVELPLMSFATPAAWQAWLTQHHAKSVGLWLQLAKKGSSTPSVTYVEALEVALCFGWIDGMKKSNDAASWLQKFTPRGRRSIWSKINREKALALIDAGRMHPAGQAEIDRAQADGRWEAAYDSQRGATVPPDFQTALDKNERAAAAFATLDSANRYAFLWRIQTAKKADTRVKRIRLFIAMLSQGKKLH